MAIKREDDKRLSHNFQLDLDYMAKINFTNFDKSGNPFNWGNLWNIQWDELNNTRHSHQRKNVKILSIVQYTTASLPTQLSL